MTYRTVPAILLKMVTEWRNRIISAVNEAYTAGQKHDPIGKVEIVNQIIAGRWDA